jgi:dolichyl-phosphate beta-glucosyltransferase
MLAENSLSIIIPAYNESRRLPSTLASLRAYFSRVGAMTHEIIIIDDGSSDLTVALAQHFADTHESDHIRVIKARHNRGKGASLRLGTLLSRGRYVLMTDADLSTPIDEVDKLMRRVRRDGYDVAIGSRKAPGAQIVQPWYRRIIGYLSNLTTRVVLGLPFRDTQCGFKLYKREAALALFGPLQLPRFSFDYEILDRAKKLGLRVAEVGVVWEHADGSTVRTQDAFQMFMDVFRVRFGLSAWAPTQQLMRFMSVGVLNTALDAGVYFMLTRFVAAFYGEPVAAKFFSFLAATVCSLMLNRYWTFGIKGRLTAGEVARFYAAVSGTLVLNVGLMYFFVRIAGIYDLVALILTTICTFGVNYVLSRRFVWRGQLATTII